MPGYTWLNLSYLSHILSCTSMTWLTPSLTQVASCPSLHLAVSLCLMEYLLNTSKEWITDWHVSLLKWLRKLFAQSHLSQMSCFYDPLALCCFTMICLHRGAHFLHITTQLPICCPGLHSIGARGLQTIFFPESLGSQVLIISCKWKYSWEVRRHPEEKSLLMFLSKHCGNCRQLLFFARGRRLPVRLQEIRLNQGHHPIRTSGILQYFI